MKQEELQQVWQERSQEAFVQVSQWQQDHPTATLAEIEETMDHYLMVLRAQLIQEVAQQREATPDASASSPPCPRVWNQHASTGVSKTFLANAGRPACHLEAHLLHLS